MPLVHRRAVPLLPPPNVQGLSEDHPVFLLQATNEIFLNYESYSSRLSYLNSPLFQCESSGKSGLSYFAAVESEKAESRIVRERFPDELKGRVLFNAHFQVMGRLDSLVDLIFDRYKDRYFAGEKVFIDLSGDKYFARIAKVFPPAQIRALREDDKPSTSAEPATAFDDYSSVCHRIGTDMSIDLAEARKQDDPDDYLYTVQLSDDQQKFEGSFMEVKAKSLSRDRLAFSKSILKRYLRECVSRDSAVGSPWTVKPAIAAAFGISTSEPNDVGEKNKQAKDVKSSRRRKIKDDPHPLPTTVKKRKVELDIASTNSVDRKPAAPKTIKYPIEDLDLDPMSIYDGRALRRANQTELPSLPVKPQPSKEVLVPPELFESFITTWNTLNIFSRPIHISPFTLDDFSSALRHPFLDPKCALLSEIHASLVNLIAADQSRVFGSTGSSSLPVLRADGAGDAEEKDEPEENGPVATEGAEEEPEGLEYDAELDALVRRGIAYAKRWDRSAKLKSADGRAGWERHVIGALCQRGGPLVMPNLTRILAHLFEEADLSQPARSIPPTPVTESDDPLSAAEAAPRPSNSFADADTALGGANPKAAYLTLEIADKIDVLGYLCALAMGSKVIRSYIDESEVQLTDLRKQRADVNKERKSLLEQRGAMELNAPLAENGSSAHPPFNGHSAVARPPATKSKEWRELDDLLLTNSKKDDLVEREFRRWQGVSRCRPLGKDRFFCRYWWFDGIGGTELSGQGAGAQYGAGRLFVQGPSQEEWDFMCGRSKKGESEALERRTREEGVDEEGLVGVDEWAFYESEEQLDKLQTWLNSKGTRELNLKNSIAKWRSYILAGSRKRLTESSGNYIRAPDARRSTRAKNEPELFQEQYLNWANALAKY